MTTKDKEAIPKTLAYSVTFGFFATLVLLMFGTVPQSAHDVLLVMVGSLATAWTGIIAYYFGSSAGSARKTEMLRGTPEKEEVTDAPNPS